MRTKITKSEYMLIVGERFFNEKINHNLFDRIIYLTESEYRSFLKILQKKRAVNLYGERIDGKAKITQEPIFFTEEYI